MARHLMQTLTALLVISPLAAAPVRADPVSHPRSGKARGHGAPNFDVNTVGFTAGSDYGHQLHFGEHIYKAGETMYPMATITMKSGAGAPPSTIKAVLQYSAVGAPDNGSRHVLSLKLLRGAAPHYDYGGTVRINAIPQEDGIAEWSYHDARNYSDSDAIQIENGFRRGRAQFSWNDTEDVVTSNLEALQSAGFAVFRLISVDSPAIVAKAAVKNQADLFYFSGGGYSASGRIANLAESIQEGKDGQLPRVGPWDIRPEANWADDLDCFVIAGCIVLNMPSITHQSQYSVPWGDVFEWTLENPPRELSEEANYNTLYIENGRVWADYCLAGRSHGGHLKALCGYCGPGPGDSSGVPQVVAAEFSRILSGLNPKPQPGDPWPLENITGVQYAQAWIDAHGDLHSYACGMDNSNYMFRYKTPSKKYGLFGPSVWKKAWTSYSLDESPKLDPKILR